GDDATAAQGDGEAGETGSGADPQPVDSPLSRGPRKLIILGVLVLLLGGGLAAALARPAARREEALQATPKAETLLTEMARLDDSRAAGTLAVEEHRERRATLKRALLAELHRATRRKRRA